MAKQLHLSGIGGPLEAAEVSGANAARDEVDLARLEPQHLGVLVRHDLECDPVEIRQLDTHFVRPPVPRIPDKDEPLTRLVGLEHERAQTGHLGRRRAQSQDILDAILACLSKDPADRPRHARALADALTTGNGHDWDESQAAAWWARYREQAGPGGTPAAYRTGLPTVEVDLASRR